MCSRNVDDAFAQSQRSGHWNSSGTHRIRGDILLKRDPANTTPAEEAFLTAIAVAQQQKARSFELRAALSLAKLYQNTNRAADAHAVLTPALEGFSPTPEFPEIVEAQTLLIALAQTDEVRNAAASRQRRLKLQTEYRQCVNCGTRPWRAGNHSRLRPGSGAGRRGRRPNGAVLRLLRPLGRALQPRRVGPMREIAEIVLRDIEGKPPSPEAAVAHRLAGVTDWYLGNFELARAHLEQTLAMFDPQRDRDLTYRFGQDMGVSVMVVSGLGAVAAGRDRPSAPGREEMLVRAVAKRPYAHYRSSGTFNMPFPCRSGMPPQRRPLPRRLQLAREHGMPL